MLNVAGRAISQHALTAQRILADQHAAQARVDTPTIWLSSVVLVARVGLAHDARRW